MNRPSAWVPPTTGTGNGTHGPVRVQTIETSGWARPLVARGPDERDDEAVHRVRQEQEPEDRLHLFATQARPAGDRLGDGSRDAPAYAGERCIADSQGSVVDVHTGRVPLTELGETCRYR